MKNERKYIYIILLVTVVITAFFQFKGKTEQTSIPILNESCILEYGESECIDEKIYTPFYNPNNISINTVKLFIPKSNGVDIYNVMESLKSDESEALTTADCYNIENLTQFMLKVKLKWCCGESCYETYMNNTNENVTLSKK